MVKIYDVKPTNVVQSWIRLMGAADDGTDIFMIGNALFGADASKTPTSNVLKGCGLNDGKDTVGYDSITYPMNSYCSLLIY